MRPHHLFDLVLFGNVSLDRYGPSAGLRYLANSLPGCFLVGAVVYPDRGALPSQACRRRPAYPARRPGDERRFAFEPLLHALNRPSGLSVSHYPSAASRCTAALMSERWVKAWGKLPRASPELPISSAYRPRWLA